MMIILAYLFSVILLGYSLLMGVPIHLRTVPRYLYLLFNSKKGWLNKFYVLRGLSFSILTILSILVSIRTIIGPNLLWFFITLVFILVNIGSWVYMIRDSANYLKEVYEQREKTK